jgi:ubiquinone/menaquinone biosynthesis C-methylase UbiE
LSKNWISYDSVASGHDIRVPLMFEAPARDLAARMEFATARSALDVGTGTGIVARQAGCAPVAAVDPSVEMLQRARANGVGLVAVARAPGLPFRDATFDRVTAGFVLSHVPSYADALRDMTRVLRRGGRLGVTAWRSRGSVYHDCWDAAMGKLVDLAALDAEALPWEKWLTEPDNLAAALRESELSGIAVDEIAYPIRMTVAGFLAMRETSVSARYLRQADSAAWARFREQVAEEFHGRFRDPVEFTMRALIATGVR